MSPRISHSDMAFGLNGLVYGKTSWLAQFAQGPRCRPDHEIETKRRELAILRQAAADYQSASDRESGLNV